jgi:hypothetical protein
MLGSGLPELKGYWLASAFGGIGLLRHLELDSSRTAGRDLSHAFKMTFATLPSR